MDNVMIKVEDVSMRFRMANDKLQNLKEYAIALAKRQLKYKDFWVFKNVDFEVKKGEVIGIIGRNGAGKSTLLKIIAGVLTPTSGNVTLNGNVVPMLELGSGFDADLSGRENIFLNGSILGYSEEFIKEKYDDIVAFSGLEEFIEVPIRNYSSGMMMRLAFSIATIVQPEILIVDEILAVGDEAFQKKSKRKMLELMGGGTTVLFVSHSIDQIREMCSRVVWLENGEVRMTGETKAVCDAYQEYINPPEKKEDVLLNKSDAAKYYMDALFVYGEMGENYYWRVAHQKEQLLAGNLCSSEIYAEQLTEDLAKKYRVFLLVQCKYSEKLEAFVKKAKSLQKAVLFDISYGAEREESCQESLSCLEKLKDYCDGVVTSNKALTQELEQLGYPVYRNSNAANDRMEQLSQWAVYDREILPELPQEYLSDLELINYNKAVIEKKRRQEDGLRIGIFEQAVNQEKLKRIEKVIEALAQRQEKTVLFVLKGCFEEGWLQQQKVPVKEVSWLNREELERIYSSVDIQLAFPVEKKELDVTEQNWILSSLVKVPYLVCCDQTIREGCNPHILTAEEETLAEVLGHMIEEKEYRKQVSEKAYTLVKNEYTALQRGTGYASYVRSQMKTNKVYTVPTVAMQSELAVLAAQAVAEQQQGIDVLFLNEEGCDEDICIGEHVLPVLSKSITYIYGSFDKGMAVGWNTFYFLQNYPNIKEKCYWIQGCEADRYSPGEFARFSCTQTYEPCIDVTFVAATENSQKWLLSQYGRNAAYQKMVCPVNNQKKNRNDSSKKKLLIEGSRYYNASELDEVFRIAALVDRERYEIWYLSAGASEKEWYVYDRKFENVDYQTLLQIYGECDVLLQGVPKKRYESAIELMAGMQGISIVAEEAGNTLHIAEKINELR